MKFDIPNIKNLNSKLNKKLENDNRMFNLILKECCDNIRQTNQRGSTFLFFHVPLILNTSITNDYNIESCVSYIMEKLQQHKYRVKFNNPNILLIMWK